MDASPRAAARRRGLKGTPGNSTNVTDTIKLRKNWQEEREKGKEEHGQFYSARRPRIVR
jgi:hypothetical protein